MKTAGFTTKHLSKRETYQYALSLHTFYCVLHKVKGNLNLA